MPRRNLTFLNHLSLVLALLTATIGSALPSHAGTVPVIDPPFVPASVVPGSNGFTLTVRGFGFVAGSVVNWNGSARTTTFVSSSTLEASIGAAEVVTQGTATITVANPTGPASNAELFPIQKLFSSVAVATDSNFVAPTNTTSEINGDFNHDGNTDIVIGQTSNYTGSISYYRGSGNGTFAPPIVTTSTFPAATLLTGDFNNDGNLDLLVADYYLTPTQAAVFLGDGHGHFHQQASFGAGYDGASLAIGDFNGDGKLDVIFRSAIENDVSLYIFLGNGDGTFALKSNATLGNVAGDVTVGDFNGDGILDIASGTPGPISSNSGTIQIYLGNGDGTFRTGASYPTLQNALATADVNNDGILDLLAAGGLNTGLCVLLGNGDGTFALNSCQDFPTNTNIRVADFNGDGISDVAAIYVNNEINAIATFQGNGDGTFQEANVLLGSENFGTSGPPTFSVADFNDDGKLDFLYIDAPTGDLGALVLLQTPASLAPTAFYEYGPTPIGKTSPPQSATLTNIGAANLRIASISIGGTNAAEFSQQNTCGAGLGIGRKCTIKVEFVPTLSGTASATLNLTYQGAPAQSITLLGTGFSK